MQKSGVFLQRLVFHIVGTDNQAAVSIIEANTQGFVNNLLRKLGLGEEGPLFAFLLGSKISAAQKGDLLLITGRRQDTFYALFRLPHVPIQTSLDKGTQRKTTENELPKLSFTPAVEISRVRPKHQKYIAVSIEGQQASPSKGQAKRLRELDKENKLSPDVIDGILCEEKKKEDRDVIITGAELEKFFGKEATPRQMKDQIMTLLEDWKERQPPELAKPDKKMDMEK